MHCIFSIRTTATVLAYDLCVGVQALDLGHLDVQYEYYILRAEKKIALAGKYVNEVEEGRNITDSIIDQEYKNSINLGNRVGYKMESNILVSIIMPSV